MNGSTLVGRLSTGIKLYLARKLTVGGTIAGVLGAAALIAVIIAPGMRQINGSWSSGYDWLRAFGVMWLAALATVYLRLEERRKRTGAWSKKQRLRRRDRKLTIGQALRDMARHSLVEMDPATRKETQMRILKAAAMGVESILSTDQNTVRASFIMLCTDDRWMEIVARSTLDQVGAKYERESMVAWEAIKNHGIFVIDDIEDDARMSRLTGKTYRTIAAVPVMQGDKAIGAISLDSDLPYLFYGKKSDIALQLEPYRALLGMTVSEAVPSKECKYDAANI